MHEATSVLFGLDGFRVIGVERVDDDLVRVAVETIDRHGACPGYRQWRWSPAAACWLPERRRSWPYPSTRQASRSTVGRPQGLAIGRIVRQQSAPELRKCGSDSATSGPRMWECANRAGLHAVADRWWSLEGLVELQQQHPVTYPRPASGRPRLRAAAGASRAAT